jgi:V/A-type H+-transporting ATPase subunit I
MAVAQMAKIIIVSHRSQASELLEALQHEGICHILNADEAIVSRDYPDIAASAERPKDIEGILSRLQKSIAFLEKHAHAQKGIGSILSPRAVIDEQSYKRVVSDRKILTTIEKCEQLEASMEKTKSEIDNLHNTLDMLRPWSSLETPVEEIGQLSQATCWAGLIPNQHFEQIEEKLGELRAAIQKISADGNRVACLIACLKEQTDEVQKSLRSAEFEPVNFESMKGTASELIREHNERLEKAKSQLKSYTEQATTLSENLLNLEILYDHYQNLLNREKTRDTAPATESTVLLEGWVKERDFRRLEKLVSDFDVSSLTKIEPAEDEEIPVEIENKRVIKPFEVITRLYGMPQHFEVDPTVFLAPFFALFFALCLTDAGYGLVIAVLMVFLIWKMQGDKKLMWMLGICGAVTVIAGALTGGWFGNAIQTFILGKPNKSIALWFDPFEKPMTFFILSLALGYFQIMAGLAIGLGHSLKRRDYLSAICDYMSWLVMLNSIVLFLAAKFGAIPAPIGAVCGTIALFPAAIILLFSVRQGGWPGRIGMGVYNLFSTIFYMGDVLSYLRLMALGMVTGGLAMAINVIVEICTKIPLAGILIAVVVFVGAHAFNIAINMLGAFVHTLRLQYVEFFPKFFVGGGKQFMPLSKEYQHIYITKET